MATEFHRFVPAGKPSLVDDAPGWDGGPSTVASGDIPKTTVAKEGPVCWKCRGVGRIKAKKPKAKGSKKKRKTTTTTTATPSMALSPEPKRDGSSSPKEIQKECPVCNGRGHLLPKRRQVDAENKPGVVTKGRRRPRGWEPSGPEPFAFQERTKWAKLVQQANSGMDVTASTVGPNPRPDDGMNTPGTEATPDWWPKNGEELCNLVGSWRILQRVGSHRWTTDDLVTAYVASKHIPNRPNVRYLDLGTGNGSVLQMVSWSLLSKDNRGVVECVGVEARSEAVKLARRSLAFNVGTAANVKVVHNDFRDFQSDGKFDLITGTPPYFRVDFALEQRPVHQDGTKNSNRPSVEYVERAIINQGGMPTAKQSAPARCEFRGGIEAYCETAARCLEERGRGVFVVCENYLNHSRVLDGAQKAGLSILKRLEVQGRVGKDTLFAVYVMEKAPTEMEKQSNGDGREHNTSASMGTDNAPTAEKKSMGIDRVAVRSETNDWTAAYADTVLKNMSIPVPTTDSNP